MKNKTPLLPSGWTIGLIVATLLTALSACASLSRPDGRIVIAGDSVLAWNRSKEASVAHELRRLLGVNIEDQSVAGARFTHPNPARAAIGFDITRQLAGVQAEWVILDGGANELGSECQCGACDAVVDTLISPDGQRGEIPQTIARLRTEGIKVLWATYYTTPRQDGPFAGCTPHFVDLNRRVTALAARTRGVWAYDMSKALPSARPDLFDVDRVHPNTEGSARIAAGLAEVLVAADPGFTAPQLAPAREKAPAR